MSVEILTSLNHKNLIIEGYTLVREYKLFLETKYDHFHPCVKVKIYQDELGQYSQQPSHRFCGPKQAGPYTSSRNGYASEQAALEGAIDDLLAFMPDPADNPNPDDDWFVPNHGY